MYILKTQFKALFFQFIKDKVSQKFGGLQPLVSTVLCIQFIQSMYFIQRLFFVLCTSCLVPLRYNLIPVLCRFSFFKKETYMHCSWKHNSGLLLSYCPVHKIKATSIVNVVLILFYFPMLLCQRWKIHNHIWAYL